MQLVNNPQAATFVLTFLITRRLMTESEAIYFLLRYISRYHSHKGLKASNDASVCILWSLSPSSLSLPSSHQLMLFWCIMLQPAPQIKSCLMMLAGTSLKCVWLLVRSPVTSHFPGRSSPGVESWSETPTHPPPLHPTPPRQAWASQIRLTISSSVGHAPTGPLQKIAHIHTRVRVRMCTKTTQML